MSRVVRPADFLEEGCSLVQDGSYCYVEDSKFLSRPWAVLSLETVDDPAPTGWFYLSDLSWNRKTIQDCVKHGILFVESHERLMSDGFKSRLARVIF
ncbi:MAG: hypothetical protein ACKN9R_05375 [Candidatus Limnocylindrus sp.]